MIREARKQQIIEATIVTFDDIGYVKSSLAQIAKQASPITSQTDKIGLIKLYKHYSNNVQSLCYETFETDEPSVQLASFVEASTTY